MVAIDFPPAPIVGEEFTAAGITYVWNGQGWTRKGAGGGGLTETDADLRFVNIVGDTMSGDLTISKADAQLVLDKPAGGTSSYVTGATAGVPRWWLSLGNEEPETGANVGSNFSLVSVNDTGAPLQVPLTINRATGNASFSGEVGASLFSGGGVYIQTANNFPRLTLNKSGNGEAGIIGTQHGLMRWSLSLGNAAPESDGNAGNDFAVSRFSDAGTSLGTPLSISRASGTVFTGGDLIAAGTVSANGDVSSKALPGGGANFVLRDEGATAKGFLFWDRALNTINVRNEGNTASALTVFPSGTVGCGSGVSTRTGTSGGYGGNSFNINWTASAAEFWIDATNVGIISITSDYRTKKDVADLSTMWDTVKALRPIKYTQADYGPRGIANDGAIKTEGPSLFTADNIERWGFIAHELQETMIPSAATGVKDAPNLIQSPNPFTLLAAVTKALQEVMTRIETLEGAAPATAAAKKK